MNTCKTCIHWRVVDLGSKPVRVADPSVKNCTALPPRRDFNWPRTSEEMTCGMHDGRLPIVMGGELPAGLAEAMRNAGPGAVIPMAPTASPVQARVAALVEKIEGGENVTMAEAVKAFVAAPTPEPAPGGIALALESQMDAATEPGATRRKKGAR